MKIAIYETVHLDWVIPLCELFSLRSDKVSFFTNILFEQDIKEALKEKYKLFKWVYIDTNTPSLPYFKQVSKFFNSDHYHCIILNSVDCKHLLIFAAIFHKAKCKVLMNIHDVNNFFNASYSFNLRTCIRKAGKDLLHLKADGFIVNAKAMKDYITLKKLTKKPVFWLPPVISAAKINTLATSVITVTIPGSIDEKRRDYKTALKIFQKIHQLLPGAVSLVLAGRPVGTYGNHILDTAKNMIEHGMSIKYSHTEIEETEFQSLIAASDVLLSPLQLTTSIHDNIKEQYGTSKVSGNIYDAIRHGKPLIVPAALVVPEEVKTSCLFYTSEENLFQLIKTLIANKELLQRLMSEALNNSRQFSATQVSEKLALLLND